LARSSPSVCWKSGALPPASCVWSLSCSVKHTQSVTIMTVPPLIAGMRRAIRNANKVLLSTFAVMSQCNLILHCHFYKTSPSSR
jgi:hypothetical protein